MAVGARTSSLLTPSSCISSICCPFSHSAPTLPLLRPRRSTATLPLPVTVRASTSASSPSQRGAYRGPRPRKDLVPNWVSNNDETVRIFPIFVGGASLVAVLLNRALSSIAPVADATSSQSRADILTLALAVTNILSGLVWLSIKPKCISPAESLKRDGAVSVDAPTLSQGSLYQNMLKSRKQSYLANLSLYPGRSELPFLPSNTQAVILQPVGAQGIAIIGGDTVRGFTSQDQAWIASIGDKLDATFSML